MADADCGQHCSDAESLSSGGTRSKKSQDSPRFNSPKAISVLDHSMISTCTPSSYHGTVSPDATMHTLHSELAEARSYGEIQKNELARLMSNNKILVKEWQDSVRARQELQFELEHVRQLWAMSENKLKAAQDTLQTIRDDPRWPAACPPMPSVEWFTPPGLSGGVMIH